MTSAFHLSGDIAQRAETIEPGVSDAEDYAAAADIAARVRRGEEPVSDSATVRKRLGLDG